MSLLLAAGGVSRSLICAAGAYAYTGVSTTLNVGLTASSGAYSYSGVAATLLKIGETNNNASGGGSNKKKRKKLPYRLQAQNVFGESFSTLENDIQEQLDDLPSDETSAEIALYLKATQFKQTLSLAEAQYKANELKQAYDAAIAAVEYLKLIKRIKDDEEAMTLIISALYG